MSDEAARMREIAKEIIRRVVNACATAYECGCKEEGGVLFCEAEINAVVAALPLPPASDKTAEALRWTPISQTPKAGGSYVVGGYFDGEPFPRRFVRSWATLYLFEDGPEWRTESKIPIEYWLELPPHPEAALSALTRPEGGE